MSKIDTLIALKVFTDKCENWTRKRSSATQCDEIVASSGGYACLDHVPLRCCF